MIECIELYYLPISIFFWNIRKSFLKIFSACLGYFSSKYKAFQEFKKHKLCVKSDKKCRVIGIKILKLRGKIVMNLESWRTRWNFFSFDFVKFYHWKYHFFSGFHNYCFIRISKGAIMRRREKYLPTKTFMHSMISLFFVLKYISPIVSIQKYDFFYTLHWE